MPFQLCVCFDATEAFVCVLTIVSLSKVNSDGMPLPRVNEIINSLGSKSWFGALEKLTTNDLLTNHVDIWQHFQHLRLFMNETEYPSEFVMPTCFLEI